ncbi:MAG: Holliday junction branch migration protein RuvA, partial [Deltaproteobacteria bacterium]|nr:Holliday junction branch migration protein RuvA [Deltaproteobacteria bacterium]
MIAHLKGSVFRKTTESVIIDANGIGYEVFVPLSTFYNLPDEAGSVSLHIYTHVREDILALFGFHTKLEKNIFLMLIFVSGIGPKLALNILSGMGPQELLEAIARGDSLRLQAIPGVGKKTAERIALELKDRALKVLGQEKVPTPHIPEGKDRHL